MNTQIILCFIINILIGANFCVISNLVKKSTKRIVDFNIMLLIVATTFFLYMVNDVLLKYAFITSYAGFFIGYGLGLFVVSLCVINSSKNN